jgi:hypothetical protein
MPVRPSPSSAPPVRGKTSLVNLLVRFYDPTDGSVHFNGIDCIKIPPAELRRRIALVMQDPFLFSGAPWKPIFSSAPTGFQNERTARRSWMHRVDRELVSRLPDGLETRYHRRGRIAVQRRTSVDFGGPCLCHRSGSHYPRRSHLLCRLSRRKSIFSKPSPT